MNYLIGVDWGSTNFRAYLIDQFGKAIDSIQSNKGIFSLQNGSQLNYFKDTCAQWLNAHDKITVFLTGMAGSNKGIRETIYLDTPTDQKKLSHHLEKVDDNIYVFPGVRYQLNQDYLDMMRGEELQVFGAMARAKLTGGIFCLPGTHCKWVTTDNKRIKSITSYATGEIFSSLHNLPMFKGFTKLTLFSMQAFLKGLKDSGNPLGLLNQVFMTRVKLLSHSLAEDEFYSYLSGITIGTELRTVSHSIATSKICHLIASGNLSRCYATAFQYFDIQYIEHKPEDCYTTAVHQIYQQLRDK